MFLICSRGHSEVRKTKPFEYRTCGRLYERELRKKQSPVPKKSSPTSFADSPDFVVSLARGIDIIRAFANPEAMASPAVSNFRLADALTLSEVAERTGLARAVVRRFLYTLAQLGYVTTDGKYFRLTARSWTWGSLIYRPFHSLRSRNAFLRK